jgi:CO/xanthine dehydrogenase FAD-binding subunit
MVTAPDLRTALDLLGTGDGWRPIAGGTDLMVLFNAGKLTFRRLVNIRQIPELRAINVAADSIAIGAAVTYSQIRCDPTMQTRFPLLCASASLTGGVSNQNRGTLGGNIANASPAADSPPASLVYDAELELASREGSRRIPYRDFHTGYKAMGIRPDEMIVRIHLPVRESGWRDYSRKVGTRRAQAISKVCLAASAKVDRDVVADIRVAMGSVAPIPLRCFQTENALRGNRLDAGSIKAACDAIRTEISPISDVRSTADYRSRVAANLLDEFLAGLQ